MLFTVSTKNDRAKQYMKYPSFSNELAWLEWSDKHNLMLLDDCFSVGSCLEVRDIGCEATTEEIITKIYNKVHLLLARSLPLHEKDPWVMQIFVQDDISMQPVYKKLENYIDKRGGCDNKFTQKFLEIQKEHFDLMCRQGGLFTDPSNNMPFRGRTRRIRLVLYRRYSEITRKKSPDIDVIKEHIDAKALLISKLRQTGISVRELKGEHVYEWFVRWFNPRPNSTEGSVDNLLEKYPYLYDEKPSGWNFNKDVFFSTVESTEQSWKFDGLCHRLALFKDIKSKLEVGVISRESSFGANNARYSLLDKLPVGSIYTIQIVFESKKNVSNHIDSIEKAAIGNGSIVDTTKRNCQVARDEIANGNFLVASTEGIYFRGESEEEVNNLEMNIDTLFEDVNLHIYRIKDEIYPVNNYLKLLPFNFDYEYEKKHGRINYKYLSDIAKLFPIYGRTRGDGQNPLYMYFNRGGESFMFDPFNKSFKQSNSHQLWLGSTGAGKSVQLNDIIIRMSAVYNPHIIALEVGGSFDLTAKYLKAHGRKVHSIKYVKGKPIPQNPYAESYLALDILEREEAKLKDELARNHGNVNNNGISESVIDRKLDKIEKEISNLDKEVDIRELEDEEERDILNEMLLATRIAITGGDPKEEEKIDRTDLAYINKNLIRSAKKARVEGKYQMIMQDVKDGFLIMASEESNPDIKKRLEDFALRLDLYISDQVRSSFINRFSEPLDEYDLLHIDFGFLQNESYMDLLNIACITLFSKIITLAEKNKSTGRFTVLIFDEFHVITKCKVAIVAFILLAKVGRKFGLWLLLATQNVEDLNTDECKKLLSIIETWLCFAIEKNQVEMIAELRSLTDEIKEQLLNTMQQKPLYTEGVLLGRKHNGIFRCVPPRTSLALAMTEQDERTERVKMQKKMNIDELSAIEIVAKKLQNIKSEVSEEEAFL